MNNCRQKSREGFVQLLCVVVFFAFCAVWCRPAYALDTDNDGMADDWEITYGLNPNLDDSGLDPDGDKFTNGREFQDQTDPTNPASHLIFPQVTGRLPDTGQTTSYTDTFGEDSDYLINAPSYIKMDAQANYLPDSAATWTMVRDNVTGLIWEIKQARDDIADYANPHDADNTYTWYDSNPETNGGDAGTPGDGNDTEDFINSLNVEQFGTFSDWRIPTIQELSSIANSGVFEPAISSGYFPNTQSSAYWSSTTHASMIYHAWRVYFPSGVVDNNEKSSSYYVRAVCTGQSRVLDQLVINGDGTVTDTQTGLMWQVDGSQISISLEAALDYVESLSVGGFADWRLPNRNDLQSIAEYEAYDPAIDTTAFPGAASSNYWSSTTFANFTNSAWLVHFRYGTVYGNYKSGSYYVRPVRGGQPWLLDHLFISVPVQASSWDVGSVMPIAWEPQGISGNVNISLSRQGGRDGTFEIIAENTANDDAYDWTVTGPGSYNCVLKIEPIDDPSKGTVQGLFTIDDPANTIPVADTSTVTIDQDTTYSGTLTGSDAEGAALIYYIVEQPTKGTVEITDFNTGAFTYIPNPDETGTDSFTFKVNDGLAHSEAAVVVIDIKSDNNPPSVPNTPSPSHESSNISVASELSWSGGDPDAGDSVTYDIYFGTTPTPLLTAADCSSTTYTPDTLEYLTTYYWKIIAKDNQGLQTEGPVWCFTTASPDSDADGMLDSWEIEHFGDLSHDGTADSDIDGLTDLEEYQNTTDPTRSDTDGDCMADGWEITYSLDPNADDAGLDPDGDKFTNGREYQDQTDPTNPASHLIFPQVTGRLPDTGQTTSYTDTFGEDSDYLINAPSYIKMDAQANYLADSAASWAMVRDNVTGLIWEIKQARDDIADYANPHDADNTYTWYDSNPETNGGDAGTAGDGTDTEDFINAINAENFGTFNDWRMPTVQELATIVKSKAFSPAINIVYFPNTNWPEYWSSTTNSNGTGNAWKVGFNDGGVGFDGKFYSYYTRAVRGEQNRLLDHLIINSDGTVTDTQSGLMWQQADVDTMTWEEALAYCENLELFGYSDWRLPNRNELLSIVDYDRFNPAINTEFFLDIESTSYWSSTTNSESTSYAWCVYFYYGRVNYGDGKFCSYYMRAIRGGQNQLLNHLFISAPVQASRWTVGNTIPITWETQDIPGNVIITLSRQGGKDGTFEIISDSTENDGEFSWTVTGPISCNCVLKIEPIDDPSKGTSQSLFTIASETLPTAGLSGTPPDLTNQTTATFTVTGDSIISYKYKLDDGSYSSETLVSTPIELTNLSAGLHTLSVLGRDGAGDWQADETPTAISWTVDLTPPSPPNVTGTTPSNEVKSTWIWTIGGEGSGIFRYKLDDSDLSTDAIETTSMSFTPSTNLTEGIHTLYVQERDEAGNWSESGSFSITIDLTPPSPPVVSGTTPTNDSTPMWSWTGGGSGNGTFRYRLDDPDLSVSATETTEPQFCPVTILPEGTHTLYVQERDVAGNWSPSGSFSIRVDLTAPVITGLSDDMAPAKTKTWTWSAENEAAVSFRYLIDQNQSGSIPTGEYSNTISASQTTGDGIWYIHVQAKDTAGNESDVATASALLDNTPPAVTATPSGGLFNSDQSITLSADETAAICFTTDGIDPDDTCLAYALPIDITASTSLKFIGVDEAGNQSGIFTESYTFDRVVPESGIDEVATDYENQVIHVSFTCSEADAVIRLFYQLNSGEWTDSGLSLAGASGIFDFIPPQDGTYVFYVVAADPAGNEEISPVSNFPGSEYDTTPPGVSVNLQAQPGAGVVDLSWDAGSEADLVGYRVYRSSRPDSGFSRLNETLLTQPSFQDTGLTNFVDYYYCVTSVDTTGNESALTAPVKGVPFTSGPTDVNSILFFNTVDENSTWVKAGAPYIVTSTVQVDNGITLTIDPGVEVRFDGACGINAGGGIFAAGTPGEEIVFTSAKPVPAPGDWTGVRVTNPNMDNRFEYCRFEHGGNSAGIDSAALWISGPDAVVSNCVFTDNVNSLLIDDTLGSNQSVIEHNTFARSDIGIISGTGCSASIQYNALFDNQTALYCHSGSTPTVHYNNFSNNLSYNLKTSSDSLSDDLDACGNWWGYANATAIKYYIDDNLDNAGLQVVVFEPFLTAPSVDAPLFPPVNLTGQITNGAVELNWDANTESDLAGYKIYYAVNSPGFPYAGTGATEGDSPIDGGNTTGFSLTGLPGGICYVVVTAYDADGNESWVSNEISVDVSTPENASVVINGGAEYTASGQVTLTLTASDNDGITGYYVSESDAVPASDAPDWSAVASVAEFSADNIPFTFSAGEGTRTVYAWFKDGSGNITPAVSDTVILDTMAPSVTGLTDDVTPAKSKTWNWASDEPAVYRFKVDTSPTGVPDGTYGDQHSHTLSEGDGMFYIHVQAQDPAGNQGLVETVSAVLDNTPPTTTAVPAGGFYNAGQQIVLSCDDASGSGCTAIYYTADGSVPTALSNEYSGPITVDQNTALKYFAVDGAGNIEAVNEQFYGIDTTAPAITITTPEDGSTIKPLYYITGSATDAGSGISRVDLRITDGIRYMALDEWNTIYFSENEHWLPATVTENVPEIGSDTWTSRYIDKWSEDTGYTITARATDSAGNSSETTIHFTYGEQKNISTIICNLSSEGIILGEPVIVTGQISPAPTSIGVGVDIILTPPGSDPKHRTAFADAQGNFSYDIACGDIDRAGAWSVSAVWTGDASLQGATSQLQTLEVVKAEAGISLDVTSQAIKLGDPVTISGKFTPEPDCGGGLADIPLTLVITGPDGADIKPVTTHDAWGHFLLENYEGLNGLGEWTITASFSGNAAYMATTSDPVQINVIETAGYAVIVQGKISNEEGLACHNKTTNSVYKKLTDRGLLDEDIQYFNFDTTQTGVDNAPSETAVSQAITIWARDKMNAKPANLYVVLVDHGLQDEFFIYPDTITSADLAGWLDTLQAGLTGQAADQEIISILGFCHSGSFIDEMSGPNRVIITSAAADEVSYKGPLDKDGIRDGEYFVTEFFKKVSLGKSVKECFENAVKHTRTFTHSSRISSNAPYFDHSAQHPLLDDNGDNVGTHELIDADGDGSLSDQLFIGVSSLTGNAPGDVSILRVADTVFLTASQTAADLWATVDDDSRLSTIWVEIKPPGFSLVDADASGQVEMDLPRYVGVYDEVQDRYEWNGLGGFTDSGIYQVFYFASDSVTGNISPLMETRVYKNLAGNSAPQPFELLTPEADESVLTTTVLDWQDTKDPDGDFISYTVLLSGGDDTFNDPIRIEALEYSTCLITPADGIQDLTDYYWKVQAIDQYGAVTETAVRVFHTNNTNPVAGWIQGHIYDTASGVSVAQTTVTAGTRQLASEGGYYLGILAPGSYTVTADADGYESLICDNVQVPEGTILTKNFALTASGIAAPVFAPAGGAYAAVQTIELTCATPDAVIYYTIDGTDPTENSVCYGAPIPVEASTTIRARAFKTGMAPSAISVAEYTITLRPGDLTGNGVIDLADAVCAMQILTGMEPAADVYLQAEVNKDGKIGLEEVVYIIGEISR